MKRQGAKRNPNKKPKAKKEEKREFEKITLKFIRINSFLVQTLFSLVTFFRPHHKRAHGYFIFSVVWTVLCLRQTIKVHHPGHFFPLTRDH